MQKNSKDCKTQIIFGKNPVREAFKNGSVIEVYLSINFKDEQILEAVHNLKIPSRYLTTNELKSICRNDNHQGVVAKIKGFSYSSLEEIISIASKKNDGLVLILDGIEDPHNFGAILRSADAFSVDGVIIKKHNQVEVNSTVMKTSAGASNFVKVAMVNNLSTAIEKLKGNGFWVVSSDGSGTYDYQNLSYDFKTALVVGSEGFGISQLVLKRSDYIVKIPMTGHVNSLNASVACSIILSRIRN